MLYCFLSKYWIEKIGYTGKFFLMLQENDNCENPQDGKTLNQIELEVWMLGSLRF